MSAAQPTRIWWTADDLAGAGLPGLPDSRRGLTKMAAREGWNDHPMWARRREGRGGGWEYHWKALPVIAQRALLAQARQGSVPPAFDRDAAWAAYEALPEDAQAEARRRVAALAEAEALELSGLGRVQARREAAVRAGVSARTLFAWAGLVAGVAREDRLAALAPRHRSAERRVRREICDPEFMAALKAAYLRPAQPTFANCHRIALRLAKANGWRWLDLRTARRRYRAEVSVTTEVLHRKGRDALVAMYPPQKRDKTYLRPLEAVNADFHRFDNFIAWPGIKGVVRPQMVAFQDIFSGMILSWRVDVSPNALAVQLAAGDMIERWGIPEQAFFDNGREFAAKLITGGAPTRYRFKVREEDIDGLFVALGCDVHWTKPYSGQSKPIERAFRDMAQDIAKDPRLDGSYTGNNPLAKPEDYGSRAVPLDRFLEVLSEGIEEFNARAGRLSEVAMGRSFADVFAEAYAVSPIRKATEAQRRLWLMGAEGILADRKTGILRFRRNEYWADWLHDHMGERMVIRFDPEDLWSGVHVYGLDGGYLGEAPCRRAAGYTSLDEARVHGRARGAFVKASRKLAEAERDMNTKDLGRLMDAAAPPPVQPVESRVVRMVTDQRANQRKDRTAGGAAQGAALDPAVTRAQAAIVTDLASRRGVEAPREESARDRFARALELERAVASGVLVTPDQRRWLAVYQQQPEYRAERMIWDDRGDAIFLK